MDRNKGPEELAQFWSVALRKESVDRNMGVGTTRAWRGVVALRKESVDRNYYADKDCDWVRGRSPQGERG